MLARARSPRPTCTWSPRARPRRSRPAPRQLADELAAAGLEVLLDDRKDVSPGVKFNDSELIGVPTIVVVGKRLADGLVEIRDRKTGEKEEIPVEGAAERIAAIVRAG